MAGVWRLAQWPTGARHKKLTAAARAWASGEGEVELWPEHGDAFLLFCRCPWRLVGGGLGGLAYAGLDWQQLESKARLLGITVNGRPELLTQLEILESAALPFLNER